MVFKASRKPSVKKTPAPHTKSKATVETDEAHTAPRAPEPDMPVSEPETPSPANSSVEDFVGAPVGSSQPLPQETIEPRPVTQNSQPYQRSPVTHDRGPLRHSGSEASGRRDFGHGGHRFGGRRDNYGGGQGYGYRRSGGIDRGPLRHEASWRDRGSYGRDNYSEPRRDFGGNNGGETFTPDVNVPTETVRGVLDSMPEGHGFLRPKYTPSDRDIYISQSQIRRFLLRNGDMVEGQARPPKDNERYWGLLKVEKVNELPAEQMEKRPRFEDLVPVYPNKLLKLETGETPLSTRMIDLLAPIGFGQRGLIVSPPKAGKTTILKELAAGISANYPEVHLMAVLIGERPEEVTDISRNVKGEVYASNFDESPEHQTRVAEVALDRAKRLIEMGHDVVILLDSITRLARAYNLVVNPSGRTLTGGFDPAALYPAKKFLGAARCNEPFLTPEEEAKKAEGEKPVVKRVTDGGSLTIVGTALVETGSRMDDLIYEEFKGTGNMELHLSRALQERRIFPAIDIGKSGTRHDELLLGEETMKQVTTLRHMLALLSDEERTMMLIDRLSKAKSNDEFLEGLSQG